VKLKERSLFGDGTHLLQDWECVDLYVDCSTLISGKVCSMAYDTEPSDIGGSVRFCKTPLD
jgi:hypothetical protein